MEPDEEKVAVAIFQWLEIKARVGGLEPAQLTVSHLLDEAKASALLPRLLQGKPPLPEQPPLSFGQPWYAIVEEGTAHVVAEEVPNHLRAHYPKHILINRFPWSVVEHAETDSYMVSWRPDGPLYWLALCKGNETAFPWTLMRVFRGAGHA